MKTLFRRIAPLLLMAAMIAPAAITGCSARVSSGYRVYDPGYNGYRTWDHTDVVYYSQWENDTHRHHRDYRHLSPAEQQEYWSWRHDRH